MSLEAMIFMGVSWAVILILFAYTLVRTLTAKEKDSTENS